MIGNYQTEAKLRQKIDKVREQAWEAEISKVKEMQTQVAETTNNSCEEEFGINVDDTVWQRDEPERAIVLNQAGTLAGPPIARVNWMPSPSPSSMEQAMNSPPISATSLTAMINGAYSMDGESVNVDQPSESALEIQRRLNSESPPRSLRTDVRFLSFSPKESPEKHVVTSSSKVTV